MQIIKVKNANNIIFCMLFSMFCVLLLLPSFAHSASEKTHLTELEWPFDGVFGSVDKRAAQRGYQVYKQVCASCHGMKYVNFRNLKDIGFSEDEIKTIAAEYTYTDGPNDLGEMYERSGFASDAFPSPFSNEKAARAANNGAYPPDLSLIVKARENGANYLYSLLTGYGEVPSEMKMGDGMYYNKYFPGNQIAMAPPLVDDLVSYGDGTSASVDQMARDMVIFLQWAAEPEMEERKRMGIKIIIFLLIFTIFFYLAKKRIWSDVK